ncbi:MAG: 1-phosphofructokinase family hexose kinase [Longimicrobiales bacterium]
MSHTTTLTMNPAVDVSAAVDQVTAEEKLRLREPQRDPGGGGINVARAICRLGGSARAVFAAGGSSGALLERLLDAESVPAHAVDVEDFTRENLFVSEDRSDRQFRFIMPGPELDEAERDRLAEAAFDDRPDYLVASGSLPPGVPDDFYARLARTAQEWDVRFILDTSGDALCRGVEAGVFLLKPNLRELAQIAGQDVSEDPDQEAAARRLVDEGLAEVVVVSLGAAGVLLVTDQHTERIPAPTVPIRSKVGAGDSTVAGITAALARGDDVATAVRFGVAAGAAAVMTPGTELCRREDTERLFERVRGRAAGAEGAEAREARG